MLSISIDGKPLTLQKQPFYLSKQSRDLTAWENRFSDFTRMISIPKISGNTLLIEPILIGGTKVKECNATINGLSIGYPVYLSVVRSDDKNYYCELSFGNQNLFSRIHGKIADVDLGSYRRIKWNTASLNNIRNTGQVSFSDAIWMDADSYNEMYQNAPTWFNDQNILFSGVFIWCKYLFEKIVEEAELTLDDTNILNNDIWEHTAIPVPIGHYTKIEDITTQEEEHGISLDTSYTTSGSRIAFPSVVTAGAGYWDSVSKTEFDFTNTRNILLSAKIEIQNLQSEVRTQFENVELRLKKNDSIVSQRILSFSGKRTFIFNENIFVENGDEVYFDVYWGDGDNAGVRVFFDSVVRISSVQLSSYVNPAQYIPDMSKLEFIKGILNLNNLVPSLEGRTLKLFDFDILFNNDIKLQEVKPGEVSHVFPNASQKNIIKYKDPKFKVYRSDYNHSFKIQNENLQDEGVILELPFEASDISNTIIYSNTDLAVINGFEYEIIEVNNISVFSSTSTFTFLNEQDFTILNHLIVSGQIRTIATRTNAKQGTITGTWSSTVTNSPCQIIKTKFKGSSPKIVYLESGSNFDIYSGNNSSVITVSSPDKATFKGNMLLGTITKERYQSMINIMKRPEIYSTFIQVPRRYILDIEFARKYMLVYLKTTNKKYIINKLEQWNPETEVCRAELIKLP